MRARQFLGFAAALGFAGSAAAQQPPGRVNYPNSAFMNRAANPAPVANPAPAAAPAVQMPPRGTSGEAPANWVRQGYVPTPTPAPALPPPVVEQARFQEPAPPPRVPVPPPANLPSHLPPVTGPVVNPPPPRGTILGPSVGSVAAPPLATSFPAPSAAALSALPNGNCAPSCAPACNTFEPECPCGSVPTAWVRAEWLYWVTSGQSLPPLATTAPLGTARDLAGRLNNPSTTVLYPSDKTNNDFRSGFRLSGGLKLDECGKWGLDGDFFFLGRSKDNYSAGSNAAGVPIVTRPFFNAITGQPDAQLVSYPGVLAGTTTAEARNTLIGGGANVTRNICCDACSRLDMVVGYRYLGLTDDVVITEDLTALAGQTRVPAGTRFQITDRFRTENHFHGVTLGLSGEKKFGFWFVGARASVALGSVTQITEIDGATTITNGGVRATFPGGLLTQTSNIGRYETSRFAVMPEVSVRGGVQVTENVRAYAAYNYMYLSSVARAGEQIDTRVNTNFLAPQTVTGGPRVPGFPDRTSGFWAQGVSIGLQVSY